MSDDEITPIIAEFRQQYPALISFDQAARIAQTPKGTIEDHSSRGLFDAFKSRYGKRCLLGRDAFVRFLLTRDSVLDEVAKAPMPTIPIPPQDPRAHLLPKSE